MEQPERPHENQRADDEEVDIAKRGRGAIIGADPQPQARPNDERDAARGNDKQPIEGGAGEVQSVRREEVVSPVAERLDPVRIEGRLRNHAPYLANGVECRERVDGECRDDGTEHEPRSPFATTNDDGGRQDREQLQDCGEEQERWARRRDSTVPPKQHDRCHDHGKYEQVDVASLDTEHDRRRAESQAVDAALRDTGGSRNHYESCHEKEARHRHCKRGGAALTKAEM